MVRHSSLSKTLTSCSQKSWHGIKVGSLVVGFSTTTKIKYISVYLELHQTNEYHQIIICNSVYTTKYNECQHFQLYAKNAGRAEYYIRQQVDSSLSKNQALIK